MTRHRRRIYYLYHAWLACHGQPPVVDDIATITNLTRGTVYAVLWRLGLITRGG